MLGPRLRIHETDTMKSVQWRRTSLLDIFGLVSLPVAAMWGVASMLGWEEVLGTRVIPMSTAATLIYWGVFALVAAHLAFNRGAALLITREKVVFKVGRLPSRLTVLERAGLSVSMETKEDPIAETEAGRSIETTTLELRDPKGATIVVDDLSEEDAGRLRGLLGA